MDNSLNIGRTAAGSAPAAARSGPDPGGKALPDGGQKLPAKPPRAPAPERVAQAIEQIQTYLNDTQRQLQFQVDEGTGRTIVRVVNPETKEVIRQMPSEEVLKLARAIGSQGGQLFSELA